MKKILGVIILMFMFACSKESLSTTGGLEVSFYSVGTQYRDSTYNWYLYNSNDYLKLPATRQGYVAHAQVLNDNRATVIITDLNEGNYVFTYYVNDVLKVSSVQVSPNEVRKYFLK